MVTYQPPDILDVPIIDAIKLSTVCPNCSAVQAARALGVSFGDDYQEPPFKHAASSEPAEHRGNGSTSGARQKPAARRIRG
jgi:ATP-dependent phosphofructokinase / diphosphate-dependent phosphofructokinase